MIDSTVAAKKALRQAFLTQRRTLEFAARQAADAAIRQRIEALPVYREAAALALYVSDGTEPELTALVRRDRGKRFFLPRYVAGRKVYEFAEVTGAAGELVRGKYGLWEPGADCPAAPAELVRHATLHLVPGVAFDAQGVRLGRGGGFYDRLLEGVISPVCGVFYQMQFAADPLPEAGHDRRLDLAVTEERVLDFHQEW